MKLWLVRHARTSAPEGLCYGRTDVEADPAHTDGCARQLHAQLPAAIRIRCSPAARCRALADALALHRPRTPIALAPDLQEMDFGDWENRRWDVIGEPALTCWTSDFALHRPGGGENVQSLLMRVAAVLAEERELGGEAAWITHAGVIRAVHWLSKGQTVNPTAASWPADAVPFGAARVIELA
jgi:alpha-ribazole phosphatase